MKQVLIVGWYGTETIGDRAILASLIMQFSKCRKDTLFSIVSIYPFLTSHTLYEDAGFISRISGICEDVIKNIKVYDGRNPKSINKAIKLCDYVVMGGGPFDDMMTMFMVEYIFIVAKHHNLPIMLYGCGINPLKVKKYIKSAKNIIEMANVVILRDEYSCKLCKQIVGNTNTDIIVAIDPAVFSTTKFIETYDGGDKIKPYVAVNLRYFPSIYAMNNAVTSKYVNDKVLHFLKSILPENEEIRFIAMNYFSVGYDDRDILNEISHEIDMNTIVENHPLSLEQTMILYKNAKFCIGMRFHAVLMQTLLNGNNYILNYTDSKIGKIPGYIKQIEGESFYANRIYNLQDSNQPNSMIIRNDNFSYNINLVKHYYELYMSKIEEFLCLK